MISKSYILSRLPDYSNDWVKVVENQDVDDIITLIIDRHYDNEQYYDAIAAEFEGRDTDETCDNLVNFCLRNIKYKAEGKNRQTVGTPQAILTRGEGDCKHFASFIGGCLGAIERATGKKIDWCYCFASYDILEPTPYHVFVIVEENGITQYLDPTPGTESAQPVYMTKEYIEDVTQQAVNGLGELVAMGDTAANTWGDLIPAPKWYPSNLPKFYRDSRGQIHVHPLNSVPKYTENDLLDFLLYYQTIIGYNRIDSVDGNMIANGNARSAAWTSTGNETSMMWAKSAFQADANGDGSGDWARIPTNSVGIDGSLYAKLQQRYIVNEATTMPWLSDMQAKGGGIDLLTIPMATDIEIPRPSFYPKYLPSLFVSAGLPYQWPAGSLNSKPKIRGGKSSGYTEYIPTATDVAAIMMYAQPVIALGKTPYPVNWYINDTVNGAQAMYFKISPAISNALGHTDAQEQGWGYVGDMMQPPNLDADPYTSGFSHTLQSIVSAVVSFFTAKIPGGTTLTTAAYTLAKAGGAGITGGGTSPQGTFSAAVFSAADQLSKTIEQQKKTQNVIVIALLALAGLAYYYEDELNKFLK